MGYIIVIAQVPGIYGCSKQTSSSGYALGLGLFTAINPWHLCYNYYLYTLQHNIQCLRFCFFSPTGGFSGNGWNCFSSTVLVGQGQLLCSVAWDPGTAALPDASKERDIKETRHLINLWLWSQNFTLHDLIYEITHSE